MPPCGGVRHSIAKKRNEGKPGWGELPECPHDIEML